MLGDVLSNLAGDFLQWILLIAGVVIWLRGGFSGIADEQSSKSVFFQDSEYNDPVHDLVRDPNKFDSTPYYDEVRKQ